MSRKIIGVTVGTTLPKPNFKQTDPTKGDYIKNKPDFDGLKTDVEELERKVGDTNVSDQISTAIGGLATEGYVDEKFATIEFTSATDDGTGIITLGQFVSGGGSDSGSSGGTEIPKEIIMPERTLIGFEQDGNFDAYSIYKQFGATFENFALNIGESYTVVWDGTEYEAVAQDASEILNGVILIGNCSVVGLEGNNEPFAIAIEREYVSFYCFEDQNTSHTVEIYKETSYVTESFVKDYIDSVLGVLENGSY